MTPAGALTKRVDKVLSGGATPTGALVKLVQKFLAGGFTPTGSVTKLVSKTFTGGFTPVGAVVKLVSRAFSGTLASAGVVTKALAKTLTGSVASAGTLVLFVPKGAAFLFEVANWTTTAFFLEAYMLASTGSFRARLVNETDGVVVTGSELTTAANMFTRVRSGTLALLNGKTYRTWFGRLSGDSGAFISARIISK
jgi:hypothetical protein